MKRIHTIYKDYFRQGMKHQFARLAKHHFFFFSFSFWWFILYSTPMINSSLKKKKKSPTVKNLDAIKKQVFLKKSPRVTMCFGTDNRPHSPIYLILFRCRRCLHPQPRSFPCSIVDNRTSNRLSASSLRSSSRFIWTNGIVGLFQRTFVPSPPLAC